MLTPFTEMYTQRYFLCTRQEGKGQGDKRQNNESKFEAICPNISQNLVQNTNLYILHLSYQFPASLQFRQTTNCTSICNNIHSIDYQPSLLTNLAK